MVLDFVVVGKFLITDSVSLILSSLFRFSVLSCFSLLVLQLLSCVWPFVTPWIPCPSWSPGVCPNHVNEISDAVLEDCTFVGFCPFFFRLSSLLEYVVYSNPLQFVVFLWCQLYLLLLHFRFNFLLSLFFFMTLPEDLSIFVLFIFLKNQLLVSLMFSVALSVY